MKPNLKLFFLTGILFLVPLCLHADDSSSAAQLYREQCNADLEAIQTLFHQLENVSGEKTVDSVLKPLNELGIRMGNSGARAGLFYNVHPDEEIRKIAETQQQELSRIGTDISLSRPIYEAVLAVDVSGADSMTKRMKERTLRDYRRSGVDKPEEVRNRIRKLHEELTELSQQFELNINSDVRSIVLDSTEELDGLPQDYIDAHPPNSDGKIIITTDYPDYLPFMKFAHSDARRRELYTAFKNRAYPQNEEVLRGILSRRYELANLLGYENFADYASETQMIGSATNIDRFINEISSVAMPRAQREYALLLEELKKTDPEAETVGDWQKMYLEEKIRRGKFLVDSKEVRQYFQFGHVRDGILEMASRLFGITFRPWKTEVWADDVESYEILSGDQVIGQLYLDLHPRENKYKHAAHFSLTDGIEGVQLPSAALVCNFPGKNDETELMEHSQVETFLHEFGHLMHHIFAGQHKQWARFSGIATEHDFIEAPSQMLEEWVWNAEALKNIALNKSGAPLPAELLDKMVAAKEFGTGLFVTHQMFYAAMSLNYYNRDPETINLRRKMAELQFRYSLFDYVPNTHMYANFGHLDGYSAMYCTYMWSLVIAKDLFSCFETNGLFDPETAARYRRTILEPGGSKDAAVLVEDFLGRPYSFEPFANWINGESTE